MFSHKADIRKLQAKVRELELQLEEMQAQTTTAIQNTNERIDMLRNRAITKDNLEDYLMDLDKSLIKRVRDNIELARRQHEQMNADKKDSTEPWAEIVTDTVTENGNAIELRLDWNDAFIQYLKKVGIDGPNETTMVQKWLASIHLEKMSEFED